MRHETKKFWAKFSRLILPVSAMLGGAVLVTTGCNTAGKRELLTIFFDGVPPENAPVNQLAQSSTNKGTAQAAQVTPKAFVAAVSTNFAHKPFAEGKCSQCHGSASIFQSVQSLQGPTGKLCFTCHKDFVSIYKVRHQPVENGDCLSCHEAHESKNKKLLIKKADEICFECHDKFSDKAKSTHQPAINAECLSCHNPHATDNKKLLVKPDGKLCFECHDDLEKQLTTAKVKHQPVENGDCTSCHLPHVSNQKKLLSKADGKLCFECHDDLEAALAKAPFKHDPAGNGDCSSCHNPHASNEPKLLMKDRQKVCFECHEEKDIATVKAHAGQTQKSCIECHDPHLGKDKYLLKPIAQAKTK